MSLKGSKLINIKDTGSDGIFFAPTKHQFSIGSSLASDVRIKNQPLIKKFHCKIALDKTNGGVVNIVNRSSEHPIRVNSEIVLEKIVLNHGDIIQIVNKTFRWHCPKNKLKEKDLSKMLRRSIERNNRSQCSSAREKPKPVVEVGTGEASHGPPSSSASKSMGKIKLTRKKPSKIIKLMEHRGDRLKSKLFRKSLTKKIRSRITIHDFRQSADIIESPIKGQEINADIDPCTPAATPKKRRRQSDSIIGTPQQDAIENTIKSSLTPVSTRKLNITSAVNTPNKTPVKDGVASTTTPGRSRVGATTTTPNKSTTRVRPKTPQRTPSRQPVTPQKMAVTPVTPTSRHKATVSKTGVGNMSTPKRQLNLIPLEASTPFQCAVNKENATPNKSAALQLSKLERSDMLLMSYSPSQLYKTAHTASMTEFIDLDTPETSSSKVIHPKMSLIDLMTPETPHKTPCKSKASVLLKSALKNSSAKPHLNTPKTGMKATFSTFKEIIVDQKDYHDYDKSSDTAKCRTKLDVTGVSNIVQTPSCSITNLSSDTPVRSVTKTTGKNASIIQVEGVGVLPKQTEPETNDSLNSTIGNEELMKTPTKRVFTDFTVNNTATENTVTKSDLVEATESTNTIVKSVPKTPKHNTNSNAQNTPGNDLILAGVNELIKTPSQNLLRNQSVSKTPRVLTPKKSAKKVLKTPGRVLTTKTIAEDTSEEVKKSALNKTPAKTVDLIEEMECRVIPITPTTRHSLRMKATKTPGNDSVLLGVKDLMATPAGVKCATPVSMKKFQKLLENRVEDICNDMSEDEKELIGVDSVLAEAVDKTIDGESIFASHEAETPAKSIVFDVNVATSSSLIEVTDMSAVAPSDKQVQCEDFNVNHDSFTNLLNSSSASPNKSHRLSAIVNLPSFEIAPEALELIADEKATTDLADIRMISTSFTRKSLTIPNNNKQILSSNYSNITPQTSILDDNPNVSANQHMEYIPETQDYNESLDESRKNIPSTSFQSAQKSNLEIVMAEDSHNSIDWNKLESESAIGFFNRTRGIDSTTNSVSGIANIANDDESFVEIPETQEPRYEMSANLDVSNSSDIVTATEHLESTPYCIRERNIDIMNQSEAQNEEDDDVIPATQDQVETPNSSNRNRRLSRRYIELPQAETHTAIVDVLHSSTASQQITSTDEIEFDPSSDDENITDELDESKPDSDEVDDELCLTENDESKPTSYATSTSVGRARAKSMGRAHIPIISAKLNKTVGDVKTTDENELSIIDSESMNAVEESNFVNAESSIKDKEQYISKIMDNSQFSSENVDDDAKVEDIVLETDAKANENPSTPEKSVFNLESQQNLINSSQTPIPMSRSSRRLSRLATPKSSKKIDSVATKEELAITSEETAETKKIETSSAEIDSSTPGPSENLLNVIISSQTPMSRASRRLSQLGATPKKMTGDVKDAITTITEAEKIVPEIEPTSAGIDASIPDKSDSQQNVINSSQTPMSRASRRLSQLGTTPKKMTGNVTAVKITTITEDESNSCSTNAAEKIVPEIEPTVIDVSSPEKLENQQNVINSSQTPLQTPMSRTSRRLSRGLIVTPKKITGDVKDAEIATIAEEDSSTAADKIVPEIDATTPEKLENQPHIINSSQSPLHTPMLRSSRRLSQLGATPKSAKKLINTTEENIAKSAIKNKAAVIYEEPAIDNVTDDIPKEINDDDLIDDKASEPNLINTANETEGNITFEIESNLEDHEEIDCENSIKVEPVEELDDVNDEIIPVRVHDSRLLSNASTTSTYVETDVGSESAFEDNCEIFQASTSVTNEVSITDAELLNESEICAESQSESINEGSKLDDCDNVFDTKSKLNEDDVDMGQDVTHISNITDVKTEPELNIIDDEINFDQIESKLTVDKTRAKSVSRVDAPTIATKLNKTVADVKFTTENDSLFDEDESIVSVEIENKTESAIKTSENISEFTDESEIAAENIEVETEQIIFEAETKHSSPEKTSQQTLISCAHTPMSRSSQRLSRLATPKSSKKVLRVFAEAEVLTTVDDELEKCIAETEKIGTTSADIVITTPKKSESQSDLINSSQTPISRSSRRLSRLAATPKSVKKLVDVVAEEVIVVTSEVADINERPESVIRNVNVVLEDVDEITEEKSITRTFEMESILENNEEIVFETEIKDERVHDLIEEKDESILLPEEEQSGLLSNASARSTHVERASEIVSTTANHEILEATNVNNDVSYKEEVLSQITSISESINIVTENQDNDDEILNSKSLIEKTTDAEGPSELDIVASVQQSVNFESEEMAIPDSDDILDSKSLIEKTTDAEGPSELYIVEPVQQSVNFESEEMAIPDSDDILDSKSLIEKTTDAEGPSELYIVEPVQQSVNFEPEEMDIPEIELPEINSENTSDLLNSNIANRSEIDTEKSINEFESSIINISDNDVTGITDEFEEELKELEAEESNNADDIAAVILPDTVDEVPSISIRDSSSDSGNSEALKDDDFFDNSVDITEKSALVVETTDSLPSALSAADMLEANHLEVSSNVTAFVENKEPIDQFVEISVNTVSSIEAREFSRSDVENKKDQTDEDLFDSFVVTPEESILVVEPTASPPAVLVAVEMLELNKVELVPRELANVTSNATDLFERKEPISDQVVDISINTVPSTEIQKSPSDVYVLNRSVVTPEESILIVETTAPSSTVLVAVEMLELNNVNEIPHELINTKSDATDFNENKKPVIEQFEDISVNKVHSISIQASPSDSGNNDNQQDEDFFDNSVITSVKPVPFVDTTASSTSVLVAVEMLEVKYVEELPNELLNTTSDATDLDGNNEPISDQFVNISVNKFPSTDIQETSSAVKDQKDDDVFDSSVVTSEKSVLVVESTVLTTSVAVDVLKSNHIEVVPRELSNALSDAADLVESTKPISDNETVIIVANSQDEDEEINDIPIPYHKSASPSPALTSDEDDVLDEIATNDGDHHNQSKQKTLISEENIEKTEDDELNANKAIQESEDPVSSKISKIPECCEEKEDNDIAEKVNEDSILEITFNDDTEDAFAKNKLLMINRNRKSVQNLSHRRYEKPNDDDDIKDITFTDDDVAEEVLKTAYLTGPPSKSASVIANFGSDEDSNDSVEMPPKQLPPIFENSKLVVETETADIAPIEIIPVTPNLNSDSMSEISSAVIIKPMQRKRRLYSKEDDFCHSTPIGDRKIKNLTQFMDESKVIIEGEEAVATDEVQPESSIIPATPNPHIDKSEVLSKRKNLVNFRDTVQIKFMTPMTTSIVEPEITGRGRRARNKINYAELEHQNTEPKQTKRARSRTRNPPAEDVVEPETKAIKLDEGKNKVEALVEKPAAKRKGRPPAKKAGAKKITTAAKSTSTKEEMDSESVIVPVEVPVAPKTSKLDVEEGKEFNFNKETLTVDKKSTESKERRDMKFTNVSIVAELRVRENDCEEVDSLPEKNELDEMATKKSRDVLKEAKQASKVESVPDSEILPVKLADKPVPQKRGRRAAVKKAELVKHVEETPIETSEDKPEEVGGKIERGANAKQSESGIENATVETEKPVLQSRGGKRGRAATKKNVKSAHAETSIEADVESHETNFEHTATKTATIVDSSKQLESEPVVVEETEPEKPISHIRGGKRAHVATKKNAKTTQSEKRIEITVDAVETSESKPSASKIEQIVLVSSDDNEISEVLVSANTIVEADEKPPIVKSGRRGNNRKQTQEVQLEKIQEAPEPENAMAKPDVIKRGRGGRKAKETKGNEKSFEEKEEPMVTEEIKPIKPVIIPARRGGRKATNPTLTYAIAHGLRSTSTDTTHDSITLEEHSKNDEDKPKSGRRGVRKAIATSTYATVHGLRSTSTDTTLESINLDEPSKTEDVKPKPGRRGGRKAAATPIPAMSGTSRNTSTDTIHESTNSESQPYSKSETASRQKARKAAEPLHGISSSTDTTYESIVPDTDETVHLKEPLLPPPSTSRRGGKRAVTAEKEVEVSSVPAKRARGRGKNTETEEQEPPIIEEEHKEEECQTTSDVTVEKEPTNNRRRGRVAKTLVSAEAIVKETVELPIVPETSVETTVPTKRGRGAKKITKPDEVIIVEAKKESTAAPVVENKRAKRGVVVAEAEVIPPKRKRGQKDEETAVTVTEATEKETESKTSEVEVVPTSTRATRRRGKK